LGGKAKGVDHDAPYGEAISNRSTASSRPTACVLDQNFTLFSEYATAAVPYSMVFALLGFDRRGRVIYPLARAGLWRRR
ncbi:hypothetical protein THAOC_21566, partial [Thalassiosira oceanica]